MVLSTTWQVTDDDLLTHIFAVQSGKVPDYIGGYTEAVRTSIADAPVQPVLFEEASPAKLSARQTQPCPQLGLPSKSPRRPSSILRSSGFSSLSASQRGDDLCVQPKRRGAPTLLGKLLKQDTIPCSTTGRRFHGAPGELIRIYIKMPSIEASISMWVDPDLPIHSVASDAWTTTTAPPVPAESSESVSTAHLLQQPPQQSHASPSSCDVSSSISPMKSSTLSHIVSGVFCLQDIIEQATGILVQKQILRVGPMRLDLNGETHVPAGSTLYTCGIHHGTQIFMSDTGRAVHELLLGKSQYNRTGGAWVMPRWQYAHKPHIFGQFPSDGYLSSQSPFYQRTVPADNEPCDSIRGRFTPRR